MGRRKLEMKRIEDKSSRQVAFSKRRAGLMKKARHLSVLCDVDVGVVIFSGRGKLYEFCSRSSLGEILRRYERAIHEPEAGVATRACEAKENHSQSASFRSSGELLEMVQRCAEEPCLEELNVPDLLQLEEDLHAALMQTRIRKTQLMMEYVKSLHEKEQVLCKENKEMEQKVAEMKNGKRTKAPDLNMPAPSRMTRVPKKVAKKKNGGKKTKAPDLNLPATSQMTRVPKQVTLPLFTN